MGRSELSEVLRKIKWMYRGKYDLVSIVCIDRGSGVTKANEVKLNDESIISKDRVIIGERVIPIHRIIAIKVGGNVVWKREDLSA